MSSTFQAKGQCLCGAVRVTANTVSPQVGACHCDMCRKWGGGPLMAADGNQDVSFEGEEHVVRYASSDWAERGFCGKCGTHLFYHLKGHNKYILPVGLLDTDVELDFDHQIFIEKKPGYYSFANETKNMTGEEVFAQAGEE